MDKEESISGSSARKRLRGQYAGLGLISAPWLRLPNASDGVTSIFRSLRLRDTVASAADDAREDSGITDADANLLSDMSAGFVDIFDKLMSSRSLNADDRLTALAAIELAFGIGLFAPQSQVAQDLREEWQRERTRAARRSRRADFVQEIIDDEAQKYRARDPRTPGNLSATARHIAKAVLGRVAKLEKIPQAWISSDSPDERERKRQRERIRKRLKRISGPDH